MNSEIQVRTVPEVVYANDGTKYYPCKYCCRAFAHKRYLTLHMRACIKNELNNQVRLNKLNNSIKVEVKKETETIDLTKDGKPKHNVIKRVISKKVSAINRHLNNNNNHITKVARVKYTRFGNEASGRNLLRLPQHGNVNAKRANKVPAKHQKKTSSVSKPAITLERCKICAMVFRSMEELIMHAKIEHNQRNNSEKRIFPPEELEYFYTIFLKSNKTTCPICNKPIGNKLNWKRHLFTHSSVKRFECPICKKTFSRSDHCKYHEKRHKIDLEVLMEENL